MHFDIYFFILSCLLIYFRLTKSLWLYFCPSRKGRLYGTIYFENYSQEGRSST